MSGVKGKSGRKRNSPTRASALHSLTNKLPKAIEVIGNTMDGVITDRLRYEAALSIKDSVMGKPKQAIDQTIKGRILITPDMRLEASREFVEAKEIESKLLKEGDVTIKEEE